MLGVECLLPVQGANARRVLSGNSPLFTKGEENTHDVTAGFDDVMAGSDSTRLQTRRVCRSLRLTGETHHA
jgi:hypothetical protein